MDVQALQRQWAEQRAREVTETAKRLGCWNDTVRDEALLAELAQVWDRAFEAGRLAALDEFQDRFCVCMKS
jgi:hypothetical protein